MSWHRMFVTTGAFPSMAASFGDGSRLHQGEVWLRPGGRPEPFAAGDDQRFELKALGAAWLAACLPADATRSSSSRAPGAATPSRGERRSDRDRLVGRYVSRKRRLPRPVDHEDHD